ncbi:MAG: hypothetical protein WD469_12775 [Paenibacillaceae bacterium]
MKDKTTNDRGRPQTYTDKELKDLLLKCVTQVPGKAINPLQLEKITGIKRHVWSRRMKGEITRINAPLDMDYGSKDGDLPLPNVVELVERYWNNKKKLIESLLHVNELIQSSYEQSLHYFSKEKEYNSCKHVVDSQKETIKELEKKAAYFEKKYLEVSVKGTYSTFREEEGLKNIIQISSSSRKAAMSTDFKNNFKTLFED